MPEFVNFASFMQRQMLRRLLPNAHLQRVPFKNFVFDKELDSSGVTEFILL